MLIALLLPSVSLAADVWTPGANIEDAASIQVSRQGFSGLSALIPALIPPDPIVIPPVDQSASFYAFTLNDAWVQLHATGADIVPATGVLNVQIDLLVNLNDPDVDPSLGLPPLFTLHYDIFGAGEDCPGYTDPFPVTATVPFSLTVVPGPDGHPRLDATMGTIGVVNGLSSDYLHLDCNIGTLERVLNFFNLSLVDLIIQVANPMLVQQIQSQQASLEAQVEAALNSAYLNQDVDVNGVPLHLELYPQDVAITPDGMDIRMQGLSSAPPNECTDAFDVAGGSLATAGAVPPLTAVPTTAHAGLVLSDDWPNQALYAIWRGGLLCYDLSNGQISLPIALDTTLLGLLGGDPFRELFPDATPMIVRTEPRQAPVVDYQGNHDITVQAHDLGVEFFTDLDYRKVHVLGIALDIDAGIDAALDDTTGQMAVNVALGDNDIGVRVPSDEFEPGTEDAVGTAFKGLVGTFIEPLLGSALQSLAFGLPSTNGVGLQSLDLAPHGDGTWLGAWATVGPVTYTGSGCGGGCGGTTDTASTDTATAGGTCNGGPAAPMIAVLAAGVALRRRRAV